MAVKLERSEDLSAFGESRLRGRLVGSSCRVVLSGRLVRAKPEAKPEAVGVA